MLSRHIFGGRSARRRLTACAAALGAAVLMIAPAGAPALAASDSSQTVVTFLSNYQTNLCLDSNGSDPAYPAVGAVYTDPCNGGNTYQNWSTALTGLATDAITFQDAETHFCLDSNYAGKVYTDPCNGNNTYQNWIYYFNGPYAEAQYQDLQTGWCLDSDYSNPAYPATGAVYTSPCNWDNTFQNWFGD